MSDLICKEDCCPAQGFPVPEDDACGCKCHEVSRAAVAEREFGRAGAIASDKIADLRAQLVTAQEQVREITRIADRVDSLISDALSPPAPAKEGGG